MISFDVRFDLDGLNENVAVMADKVQRKAALDLFGELIQTTPIDTGRARAGWSMDARKGEDVPPLKASSYRPKSPVPPKGAPFIIIYNNVEYIVPLNEGTATRPPRRFVQESIEKVAKSLR